MEEKGEFQYEKDDLYQILERITTWIENCDTKTSIIIGVIGVVAAIILSSDHITKVKSIIKHMIVNLNFWTIIFLLIITVALILGIMGCYFLFRVLVPRVDTKLYKEQDIKSDSLMFFSSISKSKSFKDYKLKLEKCSESNWRNDIISQVYICSKICTQKFKYYKRGLYLTVVAFVIFGITMIIGSIIV